jgi:hypothetical protein
MVPEEAAAATVDEPAEDPAPGGDFDDDIPF